MKAILLGLITILSVNAFASNVKSYACSANAGWEKYELTIKEINIDEQTKVPYVVMKKESTTTSGIATVKTFEDGETLYLGVTSVISFKAGKVTGSCEEQ